MKDFLLERQLKRIERDANNDYLQIMEISPAYYTTHELQLLLIKLERLKREHLVLSKRLFLLGASVFIWIAASFLLASWGWRIMSYLILVMVPLTMGAYLFFFLFLRQKYRMCRNSRLIESIIRKEINRRKDAPIF